MKRRKAEQGKEDQKRQEPVKKLTQASQTHPLAGRQKVQREQNNPTAVRTKSTLRKVNQDEKAESSVPDERPR